MSLSSSALKFRDAKATRSAALYTAAADWANTGTPSPKTMRVVNAGGTTLHACLDSSKLVKHRDLWAKKTKLRVCPGTDTVFANGNFESAISGWTESSAGFTLTRSTTQVLFGDASGVLHKEPTRETGAYIDHAFTIAAGDRDGELYVCLDYRAEAAYIANLFRVQVLRGGAVVAEDYFDKSCGLLRLQWTGDGTDVHTLRFRVGTDNDDERPLEVAREVVIDNIYAGPLLCYNVARKLLVTVNDTGDAVEDRVTNYDVKDSGEPSIPANTDQTIYEKEINFDYDACFYMTGLVGGDSPTNLFISATVSGAIGGSVTRYIDGVEQSGFLFRLSGKHTVKLVAHNTSLLFKHPAPYRVWAMTFVEVIE